MQLNKCPRVHATQHRVDLMRSTFLDTPLKEYFVVLISLIPHYLKNKHFSQKLVAALSSLLRWHMLSSPKPSTPTHKN